MKNIDPRARLLELSLERNVSLSQLSRLIDKNGTYLQQFVRKGSPRKLAETDRRALAQFFGVDEVELGAPQDKSYDDTGAAFDPGWVDVPRLALDASAGLGALVADEMPIGAFRFNSRWLRSHGFNPVNLSTITVAGDSMETTLKDGDEILVERLVQPLRDGIHVVRVDDMLLVKRLDTGRPGTISLISDNPAYRRIDLPTSDVEVIGKVVWKSGRL